MPDNNALGIYLRSRRAKLDPASFGFSGRRRTSGLRREEVAQRANISATWYTWLEQGRGGHASADVLERIAQALNLNDAEREHLFLIGLGHLPEARYRGADPITPRLQRVLDALTHSPAIVRTATWDIVGWNRAATVVLTDYARLPPEGRNVLRMMFCDPRVRAAQTDWEAVARFVVSTFRANAAKAGADAAIAPLVEELCGSSPEFAAFWRDNEVQAHGDGVKRLHHPTAGLIAMEYSSFAVDSRPDLGLIIYQPAAEADRVSIDRLLTQRLAVAAE